MYKIVYKISIFFIFFSLFLQNAFCQNTNSNKTEIIKIDEMNRSKFSALTGSPTSVPQKLDDSFVLIQDEKFLARYSINGKILWQTNVNSKILFFTITNDNFFFVVTQKNQLLLINPSGLILWERALNFTPILAPECAFDGRVYIFGKEKIECFGIAGTKKWSLKTSPLSNKNNFTNIFNDNSFLVFEQNLVNEKSAAFRVSPFGEIIEKIIFDGIVTNTLKTDDGIILIFQNGNFGLCSIEKKLEKNSENFSEKNSLPAKNLATSKWINKNFSLTEKSKTIKISNSSPTSSKANYAIFTPQKELILLNSKNGTIEKSFLIPEITSDVFTFDFIDNKFFISDKNNFVIYYLNGNFYKAFSLPEKNKKYDWDFLLFLDSGDLTFFAKNWTINFFKIISTSKKNQNFNNSQFQQTKNFNDFFYNDENFISTQSSYFTNSILETLKNGNYGYKEIEILQNAIAGANDYIFEKTSVAQNENLSPSLILQNEIFQTKYSLFQAENLFKTLFNLESSVSQKKISEILSVEKNNSLIMQILNQISICPYDPNCEILNQIELVIKNSSPRDSQILISAINAVYEICRFMGRPAILKKGKLILSQLCYPQYNERVKKNVLTVMQKLADLQM